MREISIDVMAVLFEDEPLQPLCAAVCDIPNIQVNDLVNQHNFEVSPLTRIQIQFDYPLNNPVTFEFENENGFKALDFLRCVHEGYTRIYQEEESAVGDPGLIPGMSNRAPGSGPYGIWGHYMEDLVFEGAVENSPGEFELMIGS